MQGTSGLRWGVICCALLTLILFVVGLSFSLQKTTVTVRGNPYSMYYTTEDHPTSLTFSNIYDTPAIPNTNEWFAMVIDVLQSSYRGFGIRSGLLESDVFVEFGTELFQNAFMARYPDLSLSSLDATEFLRTFVNDSGMISFIGPRSICDPCSAASTPPWNPVSAELVGSSWATTASDIKQMLTESQEPLMLTIAQPLVSVGETSFVAMLPNGAFFRPYSLTVGSPITMLVYGWNDEFVPYFSGVGGATVGRSLGGFIVKLPWGAKGLPIGVYDQTLTYSEARAVCGTTQDPREWGPGDELRCIDSAFCSTDATYAMRFVTWDGGETHIVNEMGNGTTSVKMMRTIGGKTEEVEFDAVPYPLMGHAFERVQQEEVPLNNDLCTFWFLPYDVLEELDAIVNSTTHLAVSTAWQWSKESFQKSNEDIVKSMKPISARRQ